MRRCRRATWLGLSAVALMLAGLGVVGVRPVELGPREVSERLERILGGAVGVAAAEWRWTPLPHLSLLDLDLHRSLLGPWPVEVRADRVDVEGLLGWGPREDLPFNRLAAEGLELRAGPLELRRGRWTMERDGATMHVRARALGRGSGWVDVRGEVDRSGSPSLRVYVADLDVPITARPSGMDPGSLRLAGTLGLRRDARDSDRWKVDLRAIGVRGSGEDAWLDAQLRGSVVRSAGLLLAGSRLELVGELRDVAGIHDLRAVHGPFRATLTALGDARSPRVTVVANLRELRVRVGQAFEKPAGLAGSLRLEGRWDGEQLDAARGRLQVGRALFDLERRGETWRFESSWVPVAKLRDRVPLLARLPSELEGSAKLRGTLDPDGALRGDVELRDLRLRLGPHVVALDAGRMHFDPSGIRAELPGLRLGDQTLSLEVAWSGDRDTDEQILHLDGDAEFLDLVRTADVLRPLIGTPRENPTLEDILRPIVRALRRRPRLLDQLVVSPSVLRVGRLRGLGLDADGAEIRLALRAHSLSLECSDGPLGAPDRSVAIDLDGWIPRVLKEG